MAELRKRWLPYYHHKFWEENPPTGAFFFTASGGVVAALSGVFYYMLCANENKFSSGPFQYGSAVILRLPLYGSVSGQFLRNQPILAQFTMLLAIYKVLGTIRLCNSMICGSQPIPFHTSKQSKGKSLVNIQRCKSSLNREPGGKASGSSNLTLLLRDWPKYEASLGTMRQR